MVVNGKKLDDAAVAAAREQFQARSDTGWALKKVDLSFDRLLQLFTDDCTSFQSIGKMSEQAVSRERIRQIYDEYFKFLMPDERSGRKRTKLCALKKRAVASRTLPDKLAAKVIAERARTQGYNVRKVPTLDHGKFRAHRLLIEGKMCMVHHILKASRTNREGQHLYCAIHLSKNSLPDIDFCVILVGIEDRPSTIFFIPKKVILEAHGEQNGTHISFYIPLEKHRAAYRNRHPRVDWWQ